MVYHADKNCYQIMEYRHYGQSGFKLPIISLSLWHNFDDITQVENSRASLQCTFDLGVNHFNLANNYGPPPGSVERNFGRILQEDFLPRRDEFIIPTKADCTMWEGPYGDWGSREYLIASLDQSLKRLGLKYVDVFYHHRPDPETPLKETMRALDHIARQGKVLYVGPSNYPADLVRQAIKILDDLGTPYLTHQPKYSTSERWVESGLPSLSQEKGVSNIILSPLAGGQLTDHCLNGIPANSRAADTSCFLNPDQITPQELEKVWALNVLARWRGQKLSQTTLAWVLRDSKVTSVPVGASKTAQIEGVIGILADRHFTFEECAEIDAVLSWLKWGHIH